MEEYKDLIKKLKAVDNEVKLSILKYLVNEGAKSITDISKDLNINFSTAHKYLEALEKAGLITSNQEVRNRLKRIFYVNSFNIELSPTKLSSVRKKNGKKPSFNIILADGTVAKFNEDNFIKKYIETGLPQKTIDNTLEVMYKKTYDKMTLIELRKIFEDTLIDRINLINSSLANLKREESKKRTYLNLLSITKPDAISDHLTGKIFIQNLEEPELLNFVHDLRGISIHGVSGKSPKTMKDFFENIIKAIERSSEYVKETHIIDGFNFFIAPYVENMTNEELSETLDSFFSEISKKKIKLFFSLEVGEPDYIKKVSVDYYNTKRYIDYKKDANKIIPIIIKSIEKSKNSMLILKIWDKKGIDFEYSKPHYIANMNPEWQKPNASYCGKTLRFDSKWKGFNKTVRIGEIQNISLNLPYLANEAKEKEFESVFEKEFSKVIQYLETVSELFLNPAIVKRTLTFKSELNIRWTYLKIEDCACSISLAGIEEVSEMLGKNKKEMRKKILELANRILEKEGNIGIRLQIKEEFLPQIIERFNKINEKKGLNEINEKKCNLNEQFQHLLRGGHACFCNREDFNLKEFLETNDGLIYIED